ncbi:hypothetical protein KIN20_005631, partial [Parelaphostrongylus tenuis]
MVPLEVAGRSKRHHGSIEGTKAIMENRPTLRHVKDTKLGMVVVIPKWRSLYALRKRAQIYWRDK